MVNKKGQKLSITLPEQKALDLLLKVKPTDEMPGRKKKPIRASQKKTGQKTKP